MVPRKVGTLTGSGTHWALVWLTRSRLRKRPASRVVVSLKHVLSRAGWARMWLIPHTVCTHNNITENRWWEKLVRFTESEWYTEIRQVWHAKHARMYWKWLKEKMPGQVAARWPLGCPLIQSLLKCTTGVCGKSVRNNILYHLRKISKFSPSDLLSLNC